MKNWRHFSSKPTYKGEGFTTSANARSSVKETGPGHFSNGMTQENYVNPRYLGEGAVGSLSGMSFRGVWC